LYLSGRCAKRCRDGQLLIHNKENLTSVHDYEKKNVGMKSQHLESVKIMPLQTMLLGHIDLLELTALEKTPSARRLLDLFLFFF
jgi:hypothetical protein